MPFSFSRSVLSITRSSNSLWVATEPDCLSMASTNVVLPWSTWAMIATLRRSLRRDFDIVLKGAFRLVAARFVYAKRPGCFDRIGCGSVFQPVYRGQTIKIGIHREYHRNSLKGVNRLGQVSSRFRCNGPPVSQDIRSSYTSSRAIGDAAIKNRRMICQLA